jgi:hypothetical protein
LSLEGENTYLPFPNLVLSFLLEQVSPRYDQLVDYQTTRGDQRFIGDRDNRQLVNFSISTQKAKLIKKIV